MPIVVIAGPTIAAGQSLSAPVDVQAAGVFRILMPAGWTRADLTFQLSQDGTTFYNVHDISAQEVILPVIPGSAVPLPTVLRDIYALKFRSGRADAPVPQAENRVFGLVVDKA